MKRFPFQNELELALINGLLSYAGLCVLGGVRLWTRPAINVIPSPPWIIAGIFVTVAIIFARNIKRTPKRVGFTVLRTLTHFLFGVAVFPAGLLLGLLSAPHGMNMLPKIAPVLGVLLGSVAVGFVLMRWVVVPRRTS